MCLFVIDGTWSRDFNYKEFGKDERNLPVGNTEFYKRSNSRRFFDESKYDASKKFYYGGPKQGVTGGDSSLIYQAVMSDIEREIVNGNCTEISLVGWSRGAAIASEVTQGLLQKELARIYKKVTQQTRRGIRTKSVVVKESPMIPEIKFLGLFDAVAMIPFPSPLRDREWGEHIPKEVNYFAHAIAGNREGPIKGVVDFNSLEQDIFARKKVKCVIHDANHGEIGGDATLQKARIAYEFIRSQATLAGVK